MFAPSLSRLARTALAVVVLAFAAAAASPAISHAAPNQGGGPSSSDSDVCNTLFQRLKRYNDIATNPNEPKAVRDFYRARANSLLITARRAGCSWAPIQSAPVTTATTPAADATHRATKRQRTRFDRLSAPVLGAQRSTQRRAAGTTGGTRVPTTATVAAVKAHPTGNQQQDAYCSAVAQLIDEAEREGDNALARGDDASANAWYDLADEFIDRATQNGCRFVIALKAHRGLRPVAPAVAVKG